MVAGVVVVSVVIGALTLAAAFQRQQELNREQQLRDGVAALSRPSG
nr:hypothetical protein GCM10010200_033880 [Actinomadura rugatobispora]